MRVIHTSDWHLGHELYGFDRNLEHAVFLEWMARQLTAQRFPIFDLVICR
jgi:exonuclease SbcD